MDSLFDFPEVFVIISGNGHVPDKHVDFCFFELLGTFRNTNVEGVVHDSLVDSFFVCYSGDV